MLQQHHDGNTENDNQNYYAASETPKNYCSYGEDKGSDSEDDSK